MLKFSGELQPKDGENKKYLENMKWDMDLTGTSDPYQSIFFGQDNHLADSKWTMYGPYTNDADI